MLDSFEYQIKRHFDGNINKNYSVELRGAGDDPDEDDDLIDVKGYDTSKSTSFHDTLEET